MTAVPTMLPRPRREPDTPKWEIVGTRLSEVKAERTRWLWHKRIPAYALTVIMGQEGTGKSALMAERIAGWTRGTIEGEFKGTPLNVAIFAPEDHLASTIKPRMMVTDADHERIVYLRARQLGEETSSSYTRGLSLPDDEQMLLEYLAENDIHVFVADPVSYLISPSVNMWSPGEVRNAVGNFFTLSSEQYGVTNVGVLHTNRQATADPRARAQDSAAWRQIARSFIVIGPDPSDDQGLDGPHRALAVEKTNKTTGRANRFALEAVTVDIEDESEEVIRAELDGECDFTAEQILAAEMKAAKLAEREVNAEVRELADSASGAQAWLAGRFKTNSDWRATELFAEGEELDYSADVLKRAKAKLGAQSDKRADGWHWTLPTI